MKKSILTIITISIFCILAVVAAFLFSNKGKHVLKEEDIKAITISSFDPSKGIKTLSTEQTQKFIELYNKTEYLGIPEGELVTSITNIIIYYKNGEELHLSYYGVGCSVLDVYHYDKNGKLTGKKYWVSSAEVKDFIENS